MAHATGPSLQTYALSRRRIGRAGRDANYGGLGGFELALWGALTRTSSVAPRLPRRDLHRLMHVLGGGDAGRGKDLDNSLRCISRAATSGERSHFFLDRGDQIAWRRVKEDGRRGGGQNGPKCAIFPTGRAETLRHQSRYSASG